MSSSNYCFLTCIQISQEAGQVVWYSHLFQNFPVCGDPQGWLKAQHLENEDHGIWSHHFMEIDGETVETGSDFILGGSKITANDDWNNEIKRYLFLRRKAMTNLDSILKTRDTTLPTKVRRVKAIVFPEVTYGCQSWTTKKAEHRRIDAFELRFPLPKINPVCLPTS